MNTNGPRKLTRAERLEICADALYWITQIEEAVRDLWIEGFGCMLDDLYWRFKNIREALEVAETYRTQEEDEELWREYEKGAL